MSESTSVIPTEPFSANTIVPTQVFNQEKFAHNMAIFVEEYGKAMKVFLEPRAPNDSGETPPVVSLWNDETTNCLKTFSQLTEQWIKEPQPYWDASISLWKKYMDVWMSSIRAFNGEVVTQHDVTDSRFKDEEWQRNPLFNGLRQAYQATADWADTLITESGVDNDTRSKAQFYMKQILGSISPSNSVWTNPELMRETMASNGENLVNGIRMMVEDLKAGGGQLRIRQSDMNAFTVGRNMATTKGAVVFRNSLFELIHYAPTQPNVYAMPILVIPPWINKFYILDLTPEKSYIKWCLDQGLNVFCISWVNPDERHKDITFTDYITSGLFEAVEAVRTITKQPSIHTVGYCVGGTMLTTALAAMAKKGDTRINSATLLTTQVDFTDPGELKVFVSEDQIRTLENYVLKKGYLDGQYMNAVFNMLKPHDLIWPYFVNTYLKGKAPTPFDMLYWNSDPSRQAAANHIYYLRNFYQHNKLAQGTLDILGMKPQLADIKIPLFCLATKEDHIAPAASVFRGAQLLKAPIEFVLAGSGHIAGVVNPPSRGKYQYWTGATPKTGSDLSNWTNTAREHAGSWWPYWLEWLKKSNTAMIPAPIVGSNPKYPAICDAPGTYVLAKESEIDVQKALKE